MVESMMRPATKKRLPSRHFDSLEQEVYLNLWRTYDRLRILEEELFSRYGHTHSYEELENFWVFRYRVS